MSRSASSSLTRKQGTVRRILVFLAVLCFGGILWYVNQTDRTDLYENQGRSFEKAEVLEIIQDNEQESGQYVGQQTVLLLLRSGSRKGHTVEAYSSPSYLYGAHCTPGMRVIAVVNESGESLYVTVYSFDRSLILYGIVLLFLLAIWAIGGKQGLNSAIGLLFTFICIIFLFIPMIYRGVSPIAAAMLMAVLTTVVSMYLIGGWTTKTLSAILGTVIGVLLSGILALVFGHFAGISGYNVSDIEQLEYVAQMTDVKIGELLYAGILISALGAVMDVAMSVSSAIHEIALRAPELRAKDLFWSGIHVGRDMMGTMSNTLILAFTGTSINTLVFIYAYGYSLNQTINMYSIGIEIIQGVAATLGVILTVPIGAFICTALLEYKKGCAVHNREDGGAY